MVFSAASCLVKVVEPCRLEVDCGDAKLVAVLRANLKLAWYGLLFPHCMIKPCLSVVTQSWDDQQVSFSSRKHPLAVFFTSMANIGRQDWSVKFWRFSISACIS